MSFYRRHNTTDLRRPVDLVLGGIFVVALFLTGCRTSAQGHTELLQVNGRPVVNDVTQLNPIIVDSIVTPHSTEEISAFVSKHSGPISIGGAHHSMGGQIATDGTLFIDMREMNRIISLDRQKKLVTVQAGATWQTVQEAIDPANLSVKIMQSYHNFTVGGSLSVNCHGRYVGAGPIIYSVHDFTIVLADGRVVSASPNENSDLFYGAIGGYGGLGVITEATLELTNDVKLKRDGKTMPISDYKQYFFAHVRNSPDAIFHNADIYPPSYDTVHTVTWNKTDEPLTIPERTKPVQASYEEQRFFYDWISGWPGGLWLRQHVLEPYLYGKDETEWRNYEASYDVKELEPTSRKKSTYVLQEYFIPVEHFDEFVSKMRDVLQRHKVDMINVSVRHSLKDPGSLMAWARSEVSCFVMYYKQGTSVEARNEVGVWTRELIDAATSLDGSYYFPYQLSATQDQFHKAYPDADKFFALKAKYDPSDKFRNELWDKYYTLDRNDRELRQKAETTTGYYRPEDQTFLTLPEWYIVFSGDEYAEGLKGRPSAFPYFRSIKQYWDIYGTVAARSESAYPPNPGYLLMLKVIGLSYSGELASKGLYENSVGRFTEWVSGREDLQPTMRVETFMQETALDYAQFMRQRPWYEYGFFSRFKSVWQIKEDASTSTIRSVERRLSFSAEMLFKAAYGKIIKYATAATYDDEPLTTWVRIQKGPSGDIRPLPRYQEFFGAASGLAKEGWEFVDIAGNKKVLVVLTAPSSWRYSGGAEIFYEWPILTSPGSKRVALVLPVAEVSDFLGKTASGEYVCDHVFDY